MALAGKTAAITGAGSGFGRATTRHFAEWGANVVAVDVDEERVEETASLAEEDGSEGRVVPVVADVSESADVASFVEATVEEFGRIDVLYNNAGIAHEMAPVEDVAESEWDRVNDVNLKGVFLGTKHAVPHMREQGSGVVLNTASIAAKRPREGISAYVASKAGVVALTKSTAMELADAGVRVNAICPVTARTNFGVEVTEEVYEQMAETIPIGRMAEPEDVAHAAAFLADDERAGMITGAALEVDGGRGI